MRAAVMYTISDYSGLGMLGGIQVKGYKACPICLDDLETTYSRRRMSYLGHCRWLHTHHPYRFKTREFNGATEERPPLQVPSSEEVLKQTRLHEFPVQSLHPLLAPKQGRAPCCWTHETIFWQLPYWKSIRVRHALDVLHIEKNVCDNVMGTVLGLKSKTKDDANARATLSDMGISRPSSDFTMLLQKRAEVFERIAAIKYPSGYAGQLRSKVNVQDKKFYKLKTHDCHVLLQRILPILIRPYVGSRVADTLVDLSRWFQRLYVRELKVQEIHQLQCDINLILCNLESIFPVAFFTIMVHLCHHLPEQLLMIGPVHYSWMFPVER